jgi:hypothetical protein
MDMRTFVETVLRDPNCEVPEPIRSELLAQTCLENWNEVLRGFFAEHADVAAQFRSSCRAYAFAFLEDEIARLQAAKENGTLSDEDLTYAKTDLQGLLDKIEEMCLQGIQRAKKGAGDVD